MQLTNESSGICGPDGPPLDKALARTTHMAIGAHQDDIEIMALDGILKCYRNPNKRFLSIARHQRQRESEDGSLRRLHRRADDGRAPRQAEESSVRRRVLGRGPPRDSSGAAKDSKNPGPRNNIAAICRAARASVIYTHTPADKHDTHIAVMLRVVEALEELPAEAGLPKELYGCEVWRDLDWMADSDKVIFNVSDHENLGAALLGVFDSQIAGGKRYDLAAMGRRRADATYYASHGVNTATALIYAMNLTPLIQDNGPRVGDLRERAHRPFPSGSRGAAGQDGLTRGTGTCL